MKSPIIQTVSQLAAFGFFLAVFAPLFLLSFFNHPSAADDYCFADTAVREGFWQAQKYYYDWWTGRYFSNFLVHANPLVWGWYDGFRLIPALAITGLLASVYSLTSEGLRGQRSLVILMATALLFFAMMVVQQSTVEAFFWTAAVASYTVPTALTFYLLAVMIRWYRLPTGGLLRPLTAVWASFLIFAIVGSGETNLILVVLLLLAVSGYRLFFQRTFDPFLAGLVAVSLVSSWLLFRAPGNAVRMGGNPHSGDFVASFIGSFGWLAQSLGTLLLKTPVLPLSLLFVPVALQLVRSGSPVQKLFQLPTWLVSVVYIGLLAAMIFPSYYGIGLPPAFRTMNVFYDMALVGWFFTLTVWVNTLVRQGRLAPGSFRLAAWAPALAGVWMIGSLVFSRPIRLVYNDLVRGHAARYNQEMNARHEQLTQSADRLQVSPISIYPPSLFVEDINTNPEHLWNRCQAGYYKHKTIKLANK